MLAGHLTDVTREHTALTSPPAEPPGPAPAGAGTPELAAGRALQAARDGQADEHRRQRALRLAEQIPQLRQLYRVATARYAGATAAVVQAVVDGTDPRAALDAPPVPLDEETGRPTELACPVTGLPGVDADIATRHRTAHSGPAPVRPTRRRVRKTAGRQWQPADAAAHDLGRYAAYLEELVRAGQLRRLRLRAHSDPAG